MGIRLATSNPEEISQALDRALACQHLCVLEVVQDPAVKPLMAKRGAIAKQPDVGAPQATPAKSEPQKCRPSKPQQRVARHSHGPQDNLMEVLAIAGKAPSLLKVAMRGWRPPTQVYLGPRHYVDTSEAAQLLPAASPWPVRLARPSEIANSSGEELGFHLDSEASAAFDSAWRTALRPTFAAQAAVSALDAYLESGLSRGRRLFLCVLAMPPHTWTKVHAHPNIEFAACLAGRMHEVRLVGPPWPLDGRGQYNAEADGPMPEPPNLNAWASAQGRAPSTEDRAVAAFERILQPGEFLANDIGSVHQSFTRDEGCLLLVLWSGCHANIRPCQCDKVSTLFRPDAGWDSERDALRPVHSGGL